MKREPATISVKDLHKSFRDGKDKVLKGVSIDFPPGKLTYILGPSGTGKSVLIKHLLGLMKADSGQVWVDGKEITKLKGRALAEHREIFGMLFQNSALFDDMTVFDNVAFPLREHHDDLPESVITTRVREALESLGMKEGHDKFPNEISGGMRKRVGLARAIIREPSILLYDEPTTGLDPVTRKTVDELIADLKQRLNTTSIVISHDIPSALKLANQIAFLYQGKLVFWGKPEDFKTADVPIIRDFLNAEQESAQSLRGSKASASRTD